MDINLLIIIPYKYQNKQTIIFSAAKVVIFFHIDALYLQLFTQL